MTTATGTGHDTSTGDVAHPARDADAVQACLAQGFVQAQLLEAQREREQLRNQWTAEVVARKNDRATARQSLDRAQDLGAELFRTRDQLKLAQMHADETYARVLDLEAQVRVLGEQRATVMAELAELRSQYARSSGQLSQALAMHMQDATRWQTELDRARQAHQQELTESGHRMQVERELAEAAMERVRQADSMK